MSHAKLAQEKERSGLDWEQATAISPLVKYKNFKKYHNELEYKFLVMRTTDGIEIKSISYHFTGRAIGTHDLANPNNSKEIMKRLNHKHVPVKYY